MTDVAPQPNDQHVDPPLPSDDMDEFIKSLEAGYGENINLSTFQPQGAASEPDSKPDTSPDEESEDESDEEEPENHADEILVNGNRIAREDVERLYNFDQYLRANPETAARVAKAVNPGQPAVSQAPQTPSEFVAPIPPETLELDDPNVKFLWDQHVATQRQLFDQQSQNRQHVASLQQFQQQQSERQAQADMEKALSQFRTTFPGLNDDDMVAIRKDAVPLVPGMMAQLPTTQALYRSMEVAAWANADMRPKLSDETSRTQTAQQRSATRKRKAGSISSSPTSAPKTEGRPQYRSDRDMVDQFAQALAEQGLGR